MQKCTFEIIPFFPPYPISTLEYFICLVQAYGILRDKHVIIQHAANGMEGRTANMFNTVSLKWIHFILDDNNVFNILIQRGILYMAIRSLVNVKQKLRPRAVSVLNNLPAGQLLSHTLKACPRLHPEAYIKMA